MSSPTAPHFINKKMVTENKEIKPKTKYTPRKQNNLAREELHRMIKSLGFWNIVDTVAAERISDKLGFDVKRTTISRWKNDYIRKYGIPMVEEYSKQMNVNAQTALQEVMKLVKTKDTRIRIKAINCYFKSMESYTRFLEQFGWKEKIADRLEVKGAQVNFNINDPENHYPILNDMKDEPKAEKHK